MKEYPFEMWLRMREFIEFEGTNEILRAFIALSGMQGPGEELSGLAEAITSSQRTGSRIRFCDKAHQTQCDGRVHQQRPPSP